MRSPSIRLFGCWWLLCAGACAQSPDSPALPTFIGTCAGTDCAARVSACLGTSLPSAVIFFLPETFSGISEPAQRCVERAKDCGEVRACVNAAGAPCDGNGRCEGDIAVHCKRLPNGMTSALAEDCASNRANAACDVVDDQGKGLFAVCNAGACRGDRCEGDVLVSCFDSVEIRRDCSQEGLACLPGSLTPLCALREPCRASHCEGNEAVTCFDGFVERRDSCADYLPGATCFEAAGAINCSLPDRDSDCPEGIPYASWCEAGRGVTCVTGARFEVACDALPDGTCEEVPARADVRCVAREDGQ